MPATTHSPVPHARKRLLPQIALVFVVAILAQAAGLVFAYVTRCRPGQGNDFCGASSLAGVLFGFVAAVIVLVGGLLVVFLRRKKVAGEGGVSASRIAAAVFGAIVLVPCAWMILGGWPRNNASLVLWLGILLGLVLIVAAFIRRREA